LMLTTSDPEVTRQAFGALNLPFEEHRGDDPELDSMTIAGMTRRSPHVPEDRAMRIATWNVNSMKARLEKIEWWLDRAAPDVLLMQETKLSDADAPYMTFQMAGYELVHHGEGRWNGVAIALRDGTTFDEEVTNFGDGPVRNSGAGAG